MKANFSITALVYMFVLGALVGGIGGFNPVVAGSVLAGAGAAKMIFFEGASLQSLGMTFNAFDLSGITGYADEHKRDMIATLVNGLDIANDVMVQPNVKNKMKMPKLTVGNGFRPFSSATEFGDGGDLVVAERELETKTGKRELLIDLRVFKDKYLAWRTNPGNNAKKEFDDYTFSRFVWEEVIKGVQREINDETAFFGFDKSTAAAYSGAATYAANLYITYTQGGKLHYFQNVSGGTTTAGESPDTHPAKWRNVTARAVVPGIKSLLTAAISGGFSATTTGSITDGASALAAFKELFRDMPVPYQQKGVIISSSYTDSDFLLDGIEDKLTKYTTPEVSDIMKAGLIPIPGTNNKGFVKPATWLTGSRRLIAGPMAAGYRHENLYMGTDLLSDANEIETKRNLWTLEAGIAVDLGFQIADLGALRIGDQA
ncbi:MAG: hypothetical protein K8H85_04290 [Cyclobacteriaceae bacterium]|nr:hypothetical protein [Cyclobacteriaceae bacterium]